MFNALDSLSKYQLYSVTYYARLAIDRRLGAEQLRRHRFLRGADIEPTARERKLAIDMLAEMEQHLGHTIPEASADEINQCYQMIHDKLDEFKEEAPPTPPEELKKLFDRLHSVPMHRTYHLVQPPARKKKPGTSIIKAKSLKRAGTNGHARKRAVKS
jgi:hypothetical protein